jgi:hypothetical protein
MIGEFQQLVELQNQILETVAPIKTTDVIQAYKNRPSKRKKSPLCNDQLRALTLASHFRLLRHRGCWVARTEFKFGDRRIRKCAMRAITFRKLWENGYLNGIPDGTLMGQTQAYDPGVYLVASEAGKVLLEQLRAETGIYFDLNTFEVVRPERRSTNGNQPA